MTSKATYIETIYSNLHALKKELMPKTMRSTNADPISFAQAGVLFALRGSAMSNADIAERMHVSPSAATQFVDALEDQGLVAREADSTDRRVSLVRCTAEGKRYVASLRRKRMAQLQSVFSVLDYDELEQLVSITAKLAEKIKQKDRP